jgi:hypothetical protein
MKSLLVDWDQFVVVIAERFERNIENEMEKKIEISYSNNPYKLEFLNMKKMNRSISSQK